MQSLPFSSHSSSNNVPHLNLDINGGHQFHFENSNNSNFGLNHIINEGRGFLSSSQPLTAAGTNNSNNQTGTINTGRGHVGLGLGVLGVSQRQRVMMNTSDHQVRRAANLVALAPQSQAHERVRVHTVIDYFPPAVLQNRSSLLGPNHEVTFTEIVRTQLLTATSTRERILQVSNNNINGASDSDSAFAWNNNIIHEGQGCNNNNNNLDLNHSYTESAPQGGLHNNPVGVSYESSSQYQNNLVREHGYNFHHNIFSHNNQFPNPPVPPRSRATLRLIENDDHENYDTAESRSNIGVISRDVKAKRSSCGSSSSNVPVPVDHHHQIQHTSDDIDSSSDDGDEQMQMMDVGDGRTHSLPCKKYGPYTCPRCLGVFNTSQLFAAHMGSHYKYETASERKRRKEAKYGKKSLRLFHSRDGLTLLPATHDEPSHSSNNNNNINGRRRRRRRRRKVAKRSVLLLPAVKAEPVYHHNELPAPAPPPPPPTNFDFERLVEVKVKEEPLDLVFNLGIH